LQTRGWLCDEMQINAPERRKQGIGAGTDDGVLLS
jgi:hypothetical protein